jgi:hypothetical protein
MGHIGLCRSYGLDCEHVGSQGMSADSEVMQPQGLVGNRHEVERSHTERFVV